MPEPLHNGLKGIQRMIAGFERDATRSRDAARAKQFNNLKSLSSALDGSAEAEVAVRTGDLITQPIVPDAHLMDEVQLLVWGPQNAAGANEFGPVIVNEVTARILPQIQDQTGVVRAQLLLPAVMDGGDRNGQNQKMLAQIAVAADGVPVVRDGQGLFLTDLKWTEQGKSALFHYNSIIPNVWLNSDRVVCGLRYCTLAKQAHIEAVPWPRFLPLSADKPLKGITRLTAAFDLENRNRKKL
jgi:hypothetical protein